MHQHPLVMGRIGLQAVADVPQLDFHGRIAHGAPSIGEKPGLLLGAHQPEELAGLAEVVVIIFAAAIRRPLEPAVS